AYGDSVARLLEFAGHQVEREYYYNDSGTQMGKFRASVEARRRGEEPPEDGYRGEYVDELAASDDDPVPRMLEQIERTLDRFRVHFDTWALKSRLEVLLDEFMDEVGVDAARWYLVNRGPDQTIEIDVDLAAERSQKNPVYYVQYAHARIAGILRNAVGEASSASAPSQPLEPEERELIKRLLEFPVVAVEATERRGPQAIPVYAIRVADDFHRFYHEHRLLGSDTDAFRLALVRAGQHLIARALDLVGVEAPERM